MIREKEKESREDLEMRIGEVQRRSEVEIEKLEDQVRRLEHENKQLQTEIKQVENEKHQSDIRLVEINEAMKSERARFTRE